MTNLQTHQICSGKLELFEIISFQKKPEGLRIIIEVKVYTKYHED